MKQSLWPRKALRHRVVPKVKCRQVVTTNLTLSSIMDGHGVTFPRSVLPHAHIIVQATTIVTFAASTTMDVTMDMDIVRRRCSTTSIFTIASATTAIIRNQWIQEIDIFRSDKPHVLSDINNYFINQYSYGSFDKELKFQKTLLLISLICIP